MSSRYLAWKEPIRAFRVGKMDAQEGPSSSHTSPVLPKVPPSLPPSSYLPPTSTYALEPLDTMIPATLRSGEPMLKATQNKVALRTFRVDAELTRIVWESKRGNFVPLYAIRDVRFGSDAQSYRQSLQISDAYESRWISIIYQTLRAYKAIHVIALSDASFELWCCTLMRILAHWQALSSGRITAVSAQSEWLEASWRGRQTLDFPALTRLCQRMGLQVSRPELRALFDEVGGQQLGALHFEAFQQFVDQLKRRVDIEQLFQQLAPNGTLSLQKFMTFVREEQVEAGWTDEHIAYLYTRYQTSHLDGLAAFLTSRDNGTCALRVQDTAGSLEEPICNYFISSSHNTYLEGGQWKGDSTVEGYVRALQQGARSVELDCWDGPNGQPQVTHGHTLTTRVPLGDVVDAIARYAFVSSPYPLILSLEVHNDMAQQDTLAHILRTRLGSLLVTERLPDVYPGVLPSPEQLKYRILVKCKNYEWLRTQDTLDTDEHGSTTSTDHTEWESDTFLEQAKSLVRLARRPPERYKDTRSMSADLLSLLVYTIGVQCLGLNKKEHYEVEHTFSLSERKAHRLIRTSGTDLIKHNLTHLTRVYPSMTKISRMTNSANFCPLDMWGAGCQLVALNWQTHDKGMEQNVGLFAGSAGYVRKPEALRVRHSVKNAGNHVVTVQIACTVISGQQLPHVRRDDETICPYISLSVDAPTQWGKGVIRLQPLTMDPTKSPTSSRRTWSRTQTIRSQGLAPVWHAPFLIEVDIPAGIDTAAVLAQRTRHDDALRHSILLQEATRGLLDLCFLRFQAWDDQPTPVLLASRSVSLGRLGRGALYAMTNDTVGYRHLALHDTQLSPLLYASLFIHTRYTLM
ncbi:phosphoinositide phospholipase C [Malassezia nana]|uniref:Phosphoinositide phospholipase C n=1 Tax=Malassezia nana TaxID=180528 RepID=A0AAF0EGQ0_9BASI|nr:phosphoinositide phospholipase C [Malassezia nana]